ncbi:MAG: glycoside hydrolase family 2 [Clostridia bacterium]|nr:glycoside hydrolase family 2 [Clostridia bacterium]
MLFFKHDEKKARERKKKYLRNLYTEAGERLAAEPDRIPWDVYPRPLLKRAEWLNLNGTWEFENDGVEATSIRVPFCPESILSGIGEEIRPGSALRYTRRFTVPESWRGKRVLLHFGGVSCMCGVSLNGRTAGFFSNGYAPFTAEVTDLVKVGDENVLSVTAVNDISDIYPHGKQKENRGGMWYTPVSGIWQTVWLEPVPEKYVSGLEITADLEGADIVLNERLSGTAVCCGKEYPIRDGKVRIEPENPENWTPENPKLYPFTVRCMGDEFESYFALRTLSVGEFEGKKRLFLNGKPFFFNGILDQGYFSDGIYTPAEPGEYTRDILLAKALGFNMLRKHIKTEPDFFYAECDRLGIAVFQDMVNNGTYSFFRDTLLPTVGLQKLKDRRGNSRKSAREEFEKAVEKTVARLKNHPCICYWTVFNEGWGQFDADRFYNKVKGLDGTRFVDATSGWFRQKESDVESLHIYFRKLPKKAAAVAAAGAGAASRPLVVSEFGGYVWKCEEHSFNVKKTYGYRIFKTREAFTAALADLYLSQVVPLAREGLSAAVYTQLSDVEDETNGLVTYDRKVVKVTPEEMRRVREALEEAAKGV